MDGIEINPKKMGGKPVIRGTRIPVYFILELLTNGWSFEEILENYPGLMRGRFGSPSGKLKKEITDTSPSPTL